MATTARKIMAAVAGAVLAACVALPMPALAAEGTRSGDSSTMGGSGPIKDEMTPELKAKIRKGLDWLKKNVNNDGSGKQSGGEQAGIMALVGIAFMADG